MEKNTAGGIPKGKKRVFAGKFTVAIGFERNGRPKTERATPAVHPYFLSAWQWEPNQLPPVPPAKTPTHLRERMPLVETLRLKVEVPRFDDRENRSNPPASVRLWNRFQFSGIPSDRGPRDAVFASWGVVTGLGS
jgi:hypothetical protein